MNRTASIINTLRLGASSALPMLFSASVAHAAIFTVGTPVGAGQCTHGTIQAAVAAAEGNADADTIRITRSLTYTAQAITIATSQHLNIVGGFATCNQTATDNTSTTISGAGGATEPVFRITGNTGAIIKIRHLTITEGDEDGSGHGGGIFFRGNGILELIESSVTNNVAGYGGGIYAEGAGTDTELVISNNVVISGNTARYSGGGVYADQIEMSMLAPGSIIAFNEALGNDDTGGYGGGLVIRAGNLSSYAYIGSGLGALGAIYSNEARYGGGVAVGGINDDSGEYSHSELHLFTTDPAHQANISGNFASLRGGGVHIKSDAGTTDGTVLASAKLWNAVLHDNGAPTGAAVHLETADSAFLLNPPSSALYFNVAPWPVGAVGCAASNDCGRITGNVANMGSVFAGYGAILHAEDETSIYLGEYFDTDEPPRGGIVIQDNRGRNLILTGTSDDTRSPVRLRNVLISDNEFTADPIRVSSSGDLVIKDATIAGNMVSGNQLIWASNKPVKIERSILWQPGLATLSLNGGSLTTQHIIANEVASLVGGGFDVILANPRFIDPANGDFRLRAASPAVDFAPPIVGDDRDVFGLPHDQDLSIVPDVDGVRDIGAFERQNLQPLVLNADFDFADLRLWAWYAGEWDGTQNVVGGANSGTWKFSGTGLTQQRVHVGQQCIHVPGPGRYLLNGHGHGGGSTFVSRDYAILTWEYRQNGTEDCNVGEPTTSGQLVLGSGTSWGHPAQPAIIDVTADEWGTDSSITITLTAEDGGITSPRSISAWFDGITLDVQSLDDSIFADDFEA